MSCNACRVLRKGCSDDCTIRPCLQWIKSPESQANATLFLTKFYGRAGLINLIEAGPPNLRPAIFRSLLYEACGRVANPVSGSVGLLWSGNWGLCQAAVEAVFGRSSIMQVPSSFSETEEGKGLELISNPLENIRHVSKTQNFTVLRPENRRQLKRSMINLSNFQMSDLTVKISSGKLCLDQIPHPVVTNVSSETVEDSLVNRVNRHGLLQFNDHRDSEGGLDLSLGFCPPPSQIPDFLRQSNAGVHRQTQSMI